MKLGVFSHCVIDTITIRDKTFEQIGGPACYGSIMARKFKFNVDLYTKFGSDFPEEYLKKNNINIKNSLSTKDTTRFKINVQDSDRVLSLENTCDDIEYLGDCNADGFLVSPVFKEITTSVFDSIKRDSNFTMIDPQGFLRQTNEDKTVFLGEKSIDLSKISAIKLNPEEAKMITGGTDIESLKKIQKDGIKYILITNKTDVSLLVEDKIYSLKLPNKTVYDTTGIGDIFCSAFCCTILKEKDFLWALCFAGGSAQAALESHEIGLQKIPDRGIVETNASYFYNTVKFRQV